MFQQTNFFIFFRRFNKPGKSFKSNFNRNSITGIKNCTKVKNKKTTEFESRPALGNTISL